MRSKSAISATSSCDGGTAGSPRSTSAAALVPCARLSVAARESYHSDNSPFVWPLVGGALDRTATTAFVASTISWVQWPSDAS